jgi:hypothetical protein
VVSNTIKSVVPAIRIVIQIATLLFFTLSLIWYFSIALDNFNNFMFRIMYPDSSTEIAIYSDLFQATIRSSDVSLFQGKYRYTCFEEEVASSQSWWSWIVGIESISMNRYQTNDLERTVPEDPTTKSTVFKTKIRTWPALVLTVVGIAIFGSKLIRSLFNDFRHSMSNSSRGFDLVEPR